jgi:hypothetical protein
MNKQGPAFDMIRFRKDTVLSWFMLWQDRQAEMEK